MGRRSFSVVLLEAVAVMVAVAVIKLLVALNPLPGDGYRPRIPLPCFEEQPVGNMRREAGAM
jgi:hypothetical protein